MRVRVSESAELDSSAIEKRLESEHRGYGSRFTDLLENALREIERNPRMLGRTDNGPIAVETREYFIERFEYRVIFGFVTDDLTEVIAIVHARKRPDSWVWRLSEWN